LGTLLSILNRNLLCLPTPLNLSYFWNFGSLLGLLYLVQVRTGLFLSFHYKRDLSLSFERVIKIRHDRQIGWLLRSLHCNGARIYFMLIYIHIRRGLYYNSFVKVKTWLRGRLVYVIRIAIAFLGYVLPWGQISLWGATVITNLITVIPLFGDFFRNWLWGGFSVEDPTLNRFFGLHFFLPLGLAVFLMIHLIYLHEPGSSNPLGISSIRESKIKFYPYFFWKDVFGFILVLAILKLLVYFYPHVFLDPVNWEEGRSLKTPEHIQPEWYFLFAYAILRTFSSKVAGVLALVISILVLAILPILGKKMTIVSKQFFPLRKMLYFFFISRFLELTILGRMPAIGCNIFLGQIFTRIYFGYFLLFYYVDLFWSWLLMK